MGSSVRPEPDNWLLDDARRRVQPQRPTRAAPGPLDVLRAPSDVTRTPADARYDQPLYRQNNRQNVGGVLAGIARLPATAVDMLSPLLFDPGANELVTVGRGEVRTRPAPGRTPLKERVAEPLNRAADAVGDLVAGGKPQNEYEAADRGLFDLIGNLAAWETPGRLAQALRGPEAFSLRPGENGRILREVPKQKPQSLDWYPLEMPPEGLSHEGQQAWRRQLVNRRMGRPEGTGAALGDPTRSGQLLFEDHLRRVGLMPPHLTEKAAQIAERAAGGGFTINPRTGEFLEHGGYMVGGVPGQRGAVVERGGDIPAALRRFEKDNRELLQQPGMQAGGWVDGEGRFHIDVSQEVHSADEAQRLMKDRNEMAAWHLNSMSELPNPHYNAAGRADHAMAEAGVGGAPILGGMTAGGATGAAAGAQIGDTPEERLQNSLLGLGGGMVLGGALGHAGGGRGVPRGLLDEAGAVGRQPERITAASVRVGGKEFDSPFGHGSAYSKAREAGIKAREQNIINGFRTSTGRFVTREEAAQIAKGAKQLERPEKYAGRNTDQMVGTEDLHPLWENNRGAVGAWTPTPRGVLDRGAPPLQGTAEIDPRLPSTTVRAKPSTISRGLAESPVVRQGLLDDAAKGMPLGGESWYESGPLKQAVDDVNGPFNFNDVTLARGSGSIQNPTHNEVATMSGLLFGARHGLDNAAAIRAAHKTLHPGEPSLWLGDATLTNFNRARQEGLHLPSTPGAGERKVPWYTHGNLGGSPDALPALDTHERRRLIQLGAQDPAVMRKLRNAGLLDVAGPQAEVAPILNGADYDLLGSLYRDLGRETGARSTQQFQAGRWIGGGKPTGLLSQPTGDFTQTLEDALLHTARTRGLDESPAGLQALFQRIVSGEDIATPVYGKDPFAALYSGQGLLFGP